MPASAELPTRISLAEVLDTQAAGPLLQLLSDRRGSDLQLDGGAVQRIGGQCLQVLLAACLAWEADACTLNVVSPSADLTAGLNLLGVDPASPLLQQEHQP